MPGVSPGIDARQVQPRSLIAFSGAPVESYVREHSAGSILRSSVEIYSRHFVTILLIYSLPTLPTVIAQQEAEVAGHEWLHFAAILLNLFTGLVALGAITVATSDICLGERPGVFRSYRALAGATMKRLLWSNLLQVAIIVLGFVLLVVPGIVFMLRYLFVPVVATLENVSGRAALRRSAQLGKGFYWRTFRVFLIWMCLNILVGLAIGGMIGFAGNLFESDEATALLGMRTLLAAVLTGILNPLMLISFTLMYYDLRVRKEAYDLRTLAEDLRR
jgi:hypothetical protein